MWAKKIMNRVSIIEFISMKLLQPEFNVGFS
ncbi:hypothetical protein NTGZN8_90064 [Candidatus Nitrotoga fabula]|uniref:Uncharacterized protein n=1 Tax=Candidatus Nitrotoga fabula TaxID=2182327 RepID=A0A916FCV0_9PROT|nr:hypothetical protein NTGZN8_90064 [Candidatus Nitrotoga fabula]